MDGSGALTVPLHLVTCSGPALADRVRSLVPDLVEADDHGLLWTINMALGSFTDFGVATLRLVLSCQATRPLSAQQFRKAVEARALTFAEPLGLIAGELTITFSNAARAAGAGERPWWFLPQHGESAHPAPIGQLLWLHRVLLLEAEPGMTRVRAEEARAVLPSVHADLPLATCMFVPGISSSLVVAEEAAPEVAVLLDMLDLQFAHYALTAELDRALFRRLRSLLTTQPRRSVRGLEHESAEISYILDRVAVYRTDLDTTLIDLGGDYLAIWDAISGVARTDYLAEAINRKLAALGTSYRARIDEAASRRQRRFDLVAFVFASLTLTTSVVAVADFLVAGRVEAPASYRVVVASVALLLLFVSVALYVLANRRRWRRRPLVEASAQSSINVRHAGIEEAAPAGSVQV
jgi:hypothetical protein